ncbi:nuclear transport factor 2 family protein [Ichthyenterobacterium sp. W332]|uniref:Nuclear transport factor 2 family protein n=1 Tax=Microcosmobacter mediterraneus TaxID=3075607 RepID=A0ABU2YHT5_9FLAO|nr:nuclear transport factor 2 family protein [Ichthyenterobacterium sp. W332]MDT0557456.1 nuclear transport factor 2 family protein [Ichthyenterobacterium sp. W332]
MKSFLTLTFILFTFFSFGQEKSDQEQIEATLNNYIDAFYKGDTLKLKAAIKPRLNKFGYWKNKESGNYDYYDHMSYDKALAFVTKMKTEGKTRDENKIRNVKVLDIGNHIASAKVTANWGIDYVLLSKDNGKWMIEQVIWEGPYQKEVEEQTTTYYFIRHAEKDRSDKTNRNPHLTKEGLERAEHWAKIFSNVKFDLVYSTDYNRTKETALPTAKQNNVEISLYDPRKLDGKAFMETNKGKTVLVVGHSNTTPMFANAVLGEKKYKLINDSSNGNVYIIKVLGDSITSELLVIN